MASRVADALIKRTVLPLVRCLPFKWKLNTCYDVTWCRFWAAPSNSIKREYLQPPTISSANLKHRLDLETLKFFH